MPQLSRASMALCAALAWLPAACAHGPQDPTAPRAATTRAQAAAAHATRDAFTDLDGTAVALDDYAGHPRVLAFLDPNGDCPREAVLLLRLADAYAADGVVIIGAGEHASNGALRAFVASAGITFPFWQDPHGQAMAARGFHAVPAFEFIDRDGQVRDRHTGFASRGELTAGIEGILR